MAYLYGFECNLSRNCESVLNNATCSFEVTCFGDFSEIVTEIFDNAGRCPATVFNVNNGNYYVPITLIYKSSIFFPSLINDRSFFIYVVRTLDLSGNNFDFQPTISTMYGLNSLNLSHNDISNAQLFNHEYELPNLRDIDLSHNAISNLDVTDSSSDYWFDNLIKMNLSYNNIIKIPYQFFKYFKVLTTLDLSYNNISIVTSDTFEGISGLKYLNISSNKIIDINTSLFRFVQLIELNLSYNQISNVNKNNFDQLYELRELDISNNFIENIDDIVFVDVMPNLAIINVKYNRIRTLRKNLFLDLNNLKEIDFSYNNITYLPKNMFLRRNITFFSIKGNNLSGPLEKGLFEGMDSIPILDISHQSIRSVEDYTFFGLTKLTQLLLNDNRISNLTKNCFLSLQTLQRIDLSNNFIIRIDFVTSDLLSLQYFAVSNNLVEKIDVTDFFYLHKLQYLDLSRNNISKVYPKTFQMLSSLEKLYLSKNPLVGSLDENTFDGLYSVPLLDLSGSSLTIIKNNSFSGMIHLYHLNISHSNITELEYNSFLNTDNIEIIDLSYNYLSRFSVNTSHLKSLRDLRLSNNVLKSLSQDYFKDLFNLNKLMLSHNDVLSLQDNIFKDQKLLNYLDLSYNTNFNSDFSFMKYSHKLQTLILSGTPNNFSFAEMTEFPLIELDISNCYIKNVTKIILQKVKDIKFLFLSNNNITHIEFGAFSHLNYVEEIDMSYNSIQYIEPGAFNDCHKLNFLNISHNYLPHIKYGVFRSLAYLTILDVSFNSIGDLEMARFDELPNLSELIVDHNRISEIDVNDLQRTGLRKLSIGDNPLPCNKLKELKDIGGPMLEITGLRYVYSKDESFKGVGCNYDKHIPYQIPDRRTNYVRHNDSVSEKILIDIRDILFNISSKNIDNDEENKINTNSDLKNSTKSLTENILRLTNITSLVEKESKTTNQYLERLLKLVAAVKSFRSTPIIQTNLNNDTNDLSKLREELANSIVIEKEKMLAEIGEKFLNINERIDALISSTVHTPLNEKLEIFEESKSTVFMEVCVALILLILICFILYKLYKSRCYLKNQWSVSTRHITDMDNSNL